MISKDLVGRKSQSQGLSPTNILFIPHRPRDAPEHAATTTTTMEEDRLATNLGPDFDEGMVEEPAPVSKQPKRRFVGRKTAEKSSEQPADPNANIEDSSAIQGVRCLSAI
jgi:hypothetical protein